MSIPVKALIFDVFGTVVDWRSSLIADLSAYGAAKGVTLDWAELVDDWRGDYQTAMDRVRKGAIGWTNLEGLYRDSLVALLARRGVTAFAPGEIDHINQVWDRLHGWPDSVPGLLRLNPVERQRGATAEHGEKRGSALGHAVFGRAVRGL